MDICFSEVLAQRPRTISTEPIVSARGSIVTIGIDDEHAIALEPEVAPAYNSVVHDHPPVYEQLPAYDGPNDNLRERVVLPRWPVRRAVPPPSGLQLRHRIPRASLHQGEPGQP